MLEIMKIQLKEYIDRMDQSDEKFLKQILTIMRKHFKIKIWRSGTPEGSSTLRCFKLF